MCAPLPTKLSLEVRRLARAMRQELKATQRVVVLVPAPSPRYPGHMVRRCFEGNPEWYSKLCATRPNQRNGAPRGRNDTGIRRHLVIRSLARIAAGKLNLRATSYDPLVLPFVQAEFDRDRVPF